MQPASATDSSNLAIGWQQTEDGNILRDVTQEQPASFGGKYHHHCCCYIIIITITIILLFFIIQSCCDSSTVFEFLEIEDIINETVKQEELVHIIIIHLIIIPSIVVIYIK